MDKEITFSEFIEHICKRPLMYCLGGTFNEVSAFIQGYCSAKETPISGTEFNRFVCLKNSFPTNYIWTYVIKTCSKNDEDGISNIKETILEFIELSNRMNEEELFQFAVDNANTKEGEPEKVFRKFENALLVGNKKIIQSLILDNDKADLLWKGKYPDSVTEKLNELSENQPIKRIKESENGKSVELVASGFPFTIELILKNNEWKVNADKIIKLRTENNCA
ncbi:hypothetical protein [Polaribacter atrinae]|uniref:Uncharacterized protein n=1 Tax=Polaribacter atrinae TaxID=1333662 RepID=A0A176T7M0_9FLAO|nr:hypothetical protein [Polaribacter atrinae]OAD43837.1 hypothetical protein LPB303_13085 [Polaribacter atrinae]